MRITDMLWLALAAFALYAEPPLPRKATLHLSDATDWATLVCIGTVEHVETITLPPEWARQPGDSDDDDDLLDSSDRSPTQATFARIAVERVLKGDAATKVAYHETWSTWTCDTTSAHVGQRCLFFLSPGQTQRAASAVQETITALLGGAPVLRNVGSGDGIVPIMTTEEGEAYVSFVSAPKALGFPDSTAPDALRSNEWKGRQPLIRVCAYVVELARFAPELAVIHAKSRGDKPPQWKGFDLRIRADGAVRLSTGRADDEAVRTSMLNEADWSALRGSMTDAVGSVPIRFGDADAYYAQRSLRVALPGTELSFFVDDSFDVDAFDVSQRAQYRRALDAWAIVREAIDCPDCVDHRPLDKGWLER